MVWVWPNAGAGAVDPNSPPVVGWAVCPNNDVLVEPKTGCAKPVVAGFAKDPNGVLLDGFPNPLPGFTKFHWNRLNLHSFHSGILISLMLNIILLH